MTFQGEGKEHSSCFQPLSKIPLRKPPPSGKRGVDKTAKPMKSFSVIPPFREGRPTPVRRCGVSRRMGRLRIETLKKYSKYPALLLCCKTGSAPAPCGADRAAPKVRRRRETHPAHLRCSALSPARSVRKPELFLRQGGFSGGERMGSSLKNISSRVRPPHKKVPPECIPGGRGKRLFRSSRSGT